jgi:hypothetical protein
MKNLTTIDTLERIRSWHKNYPIARTALLEWYHKLLKKGMLPFFLYEIPLKDNHPVNSPGLRLNKSIKLPG